MIPFHKPHIFKKDIEFVTEVLRSGQLAGNGIYTKRCHDFLEQRYRLNKCLLTTSCTTALEMAALLLNLKNGDEVIVPAYAYVSTANAFALHGAKLVYVDSQETSPNLDIDLIPDLITSKTKAIVVVHYGGVAVDMDRVMEIAEKNNIIVIEDAAHGVDAYYNDKPLGSVGHFGTLSFHSTKNITSGHGGLLMVNDKKFADRADLLWQKGTDKTKFDTGMSKRYQWQDLGSSFFPAETIAAHLYGQLQHIDQVTGKRVEQWEYYSKALSDYFEVPVIPEFAQHNGHIFYIKTKNLKQRHSIQQSLSNRNITTASHYLSLSESPFNKDQIKLPQSRNWQECLLRLPLYHELTKDEQKKVVNGLKARL
jgi:dTDP-4-amino-4,6-dideoxygalactose transaminase